MGSIRIDPFVAKLISTLENEASSLIGVSDEINEMKLLFQSMRSFLVDADRAGPNSERQRDWVKNVRDLSFEIEDTIDEFTYHENKRRQCSFFQKSLGFPKELWVRRKVAAWLQDINKRMKRLTERTHQFGVQQLQEKGPSYDPDWKNRLSESSLFFKDDDLVGIKRMQHELLGWLMDEEPRRTVISVVGMGGSGKTTLVANTFNKESVKQHFDFCIWITVSQQYATEELFRSMVKDVYKKTNEEVPMKVGTMEYKNLVGTLVQYFQPRRYLIVLDDVWSSEFWQEISIALPEGMRGSRVMLTTRKADIPPLQNGVVSYTHRIQPLRNDEAWELFCKKAFPNDVGGCPLHLDSLARNLVEKCEGLPLAIVALGGLMSSKNSTAGWKRVHDNMNWELSNNPTLEVVKIISLLSYHDLSFQLKHCFLYCCIFPEDYEFRRKRLIRLWMAEGFLERGNDVAPEVVAESYLTELISRNLLQVEGENSFGRPNRLKMHDILREFALSIAKEEKLVAILDGKKGVAENGIHRYSIQMKDKEMKSGSGTSQLRSLFIFPFDDISESSFNKLPFKLKLLRVLDLENTQIIELPPEFGNLFSLRYLNLSKTQVKVLPKSIGKLLDLQTLLLKLSKIEELPCEIVKLQNLRHLCAARLMYEERKFSRYECTSVRVPPNISRINSLQVLFCVEVTDALVKQLKEMTQLTRLGLDKVMEAHEKDLCSAIGKMERLHHLQLCAPPSRLIKTDALSSAPPYLEKLFLYGKMGKVPHWFNSLHSLTCLTLEGSELGEDLLSHIEALPNLSYLLFSNGAYNQKRLCFVQGFKKLTRLQILSCPLLTEIVIEKDAMPGLQRLVVCHCKKLRVLVPRGLDHLTHLKSLDLWDVSDVLVDELVERVCGVMLNMADRAAMQGISLARPAAAADEAESKWFYKIIS